MIDVEIKGLIDEAYERANTILTENIVQLKLLGTELLEHETLEAAAIYKLLCIEPRAESIPKAPTFHEDENSDDGDGDSVSDATDDDSVSSTGLNQPGIA